MNSEPRPTRGRALRAFLLIAIAAVIVLALSAAATILYQAWRAPAEANPALGLAQRLYLERYLAAREAQLAAPAGTAVGPQAFTITPGQGASAISEGLTTAGIVTDNELFLNYLAYHGLDGGLVAGEYQLDPAQTIPQIADILSRSGGQSIGLNFLPGWRVEEMANYLRVTTPGAIDADEFLDFALRRRSLDLGRYGFLSTLPPDATLEGYLFPQAYPIGPDTTAETLIYQMLDGFDAQVTPAMRQSFGTLGLSVRDAVILASIVEKESQLADEKPLVASVYLNRVQAAMPLQADPTVQYALGYQPETGSWWKSPLSLEDLQVDSPYNTYRVDGLPPGPIANPGFASLNAIANPIASQYLFFVLDCAAPTPGAHAFSVTYDEHVANVERCR